MILTNHHGAAMLSLLPHCSTRLASRNTSGTDRNQAVFLCAKHLNSAFHYVGLGGAAERLAGARTGMPTLSSPAPMIGIMAVGFTTLRDKIMKNHILMGNHAQNSTKSNQTKQPKFNLIKRTTIRNLILLNKSLWLLKNASINCKTFQNEGCTMSDRAKEPTDQAHEQSRLMLNDNGYPVTLDYFYVAHDWEYLPGHISKRHRISPNYRTAEEAEGFLKSCNVEGAAVYKAGFLIRSGDDIEGLEKELFEEAAMTDRFDVHCYAVVIVLANDTTDPISPWFKTIEEARSFQQKVIHRFPKCRIGHWRFEADNEEQRQELIADIFGAKYQEMITDIFGAQ